MVIPAAIAAAVGRDAARPGEPGALFPAPRYAAAMPRMDLTDEELAAVAAALRRVIMNDRYPLAPRLRPLREALAKLDPAAVPRPRPEPKPLPMAGRTRGIRRR